MGKKNRIVYAHNFKDISGQKFGRLAVICRDPEKSLSRKVRWLCQCDCGNRVVVLGGSLHSGKSKSCGCAGSRKSPKTKDLTGKRFGRLIIVCQSLKSKCNKAQWLCRCDCGKELVAVSGNLVSGLTTSCGCRKLEISSATGTANAIHESAEAALLVKYKYFAAKRELPFALTQDQFNTLTSSDCHYCGCHPAQRSKRRHPYVYNGIDRMNNERGYDFNNCVPCCGQCNRAKSAKSYSEFMDWIDRLVRYHNEQNSYATQAIACA